MTMQLNAKEYYEASLQRMEQARMIYKDGRSFALAIYVGGLAVESLLRAFRWKDDSSFEGRHDLEILLKASRLLRFDDDYLRRKRASEAAIRDSALELRGAMNEVMVLWHNNLRYASEARLKAFLRQSGRLQGVKGDPLKKNALDLLEAAQKIINRGIAIWTSEIKS